MYMVGHRGCAGLRPENTLLGFRYAIALGVDAIECDVHLTRDERLVVLHDERVDRTTDGTGAVTDLSFAEIRRLDAGRGEPVPTLDQVLQVAAAGGVRLLVELKGAGTARPALAAVAARTMLRATAFTAFDPARIAEVRRMDPSAETRAICSAVSAAAPRVAADAGARGLDVPFRSLQRDLIDQAHALGLDVLAWNPDEDADIRATIALNPDGISSNRPDRLLALLGRSRREGDESP